MLRLYIMPCMQVAFASDFTQMWDDKSLGLKRAKGTGKMILLIAKSLQGLDKAFRSDLFFRVREKISGVTSC